MPTGPVFILPDEQPEPNPDRMPIATNPMLVLNDEQTQALRDACPKDGEWHRVEAGGVTAWVRVIL